MKLFRKYFAISMDKTSASSQETEVERLKTHRQMLRNISDKNKAAAEERKERLKAAKRIAEVKTKEKIESAKNQIKAKEAEIKEKSIVSNQKLVKTVTTPTGSVPMN